MRVAFRGRHVFDGMETRTLSGGMAVIVTDGYIDDVVNGDAIPSDAARVELGEATILPGLIDAHVHLAWDGSADSAEHVAHDSPTRRVLRAVHNAGEHLRAGITAVRDLGGPRGVAIEIASAIDDGLNAGPRIIAAGQPITIKVGHTYQSGNNADDEEAIRRAVRNELKRGARYIKLIDSSGASDGNHHASCAGKSAVTGIRAAVDEAGRSGCPVAMHAHSRRAIGNAVAAGVRSIEHGACLDSAIARRMYCSDVFFVPALSSLPTSLGMPKREELRIDSAPDISALVEYSNSAFRTALRHDVPLAAGSASGMPGQRHGSLPHEITAMVAAGATARQALRAATANAARLLGISAEHGTVEPGKRADLLVVAGNPESEIDHIHDVTMVVLAGRALPVGRHRFAPEPPRRRREDRIRQVRDFMHVHRMLTAHLIKEIRHPDYSPSQRQILLEIGGRRKVDVKDLRHLLDMDAGQLSRTLRQLQASGDIQIRRRIDDRRRQLVVATDVGMRNSAQLNAALSDVIDQFLAQLPVAGQESLLDAIRVIRELAPR